MVEVPLLHVDQLTVDRTGAPSDPAVLDGFALRMEPGETHVVIGAGDQDLRALGPALLGSPSHRVTGGRLLFHGDDITGWTTDMRAKAGLFLASADPSSLPGVTILQLVGQAVTARRGIETDLAEVRLDLLRWAERLAIDPSFLDREVNEGLSPADTRRNELLQVALLEPELVILDETGPLPAADSADSADTDHGEPAEDIGSALAEALDTVRAERPTLGTLAITQCQRLVDHLEPDHVHIMVAGRIAATGGPDLTTHLATEGYESVT